MSSVWSTKVGRAKRSLAGRLAVYLERGYDHSIIPDGTLSLCLLICGDGPTMPREGDLQGVARSNARALYCECADGVTRRVSSESYFGTEVVTALTAFTSGRVRPAPAGTVTFGPTPAEADPNTKA
jgi:hypothetical protein